MQSAKHYIIRHSILDASGTCISHVENEIPVQVGSAVPSSALLSINNPMLWDINQPYCYNLKTELLENEQVIEEEVQTFGFRTMEFDSQQGFLLNGRKVKIHGVCQHHDLGCLGAAVNKTALKDRLSSCRRWA